MRVKRNFLRCGLLFIVIFFLAVCASSSSSVNFHDRSIYGDYGIDYNFKNTVPIRTTIKTEDGDEPAPVKSGENSLLPHQFTNKITGFAYSSATGIVISHNGYILTNYHVVDRDPILIEVTIDQIASQATVVAEDRMNDLAVIKVDRAFLNIAHFGSNKNIKINQTIYYWGYPFGLSRNSAGKCFHRGYISRTNARIIFFSKAGLPRFFMGIRGAPGVSGSGIYTTDGRIIGVMQGYVASGQHFVAIPVDQVTNFLRHSKIPFSG